MGSEPSGQLLSSQARTSWAFLAEGLKFKGNPCWLMASRGTERSVGPPVGATHSEAEACHSNLNSEPQGTHGKRAGLV